MSSARGGAPRGRGRGSRVAQQGLVRGASNVRGRGSSNNAQRGTGTGRGAFGQQTRGNTLQQPRGLGSLNGFTKQIRSGAFGGAQTNGNWQERYQALEKARERERADAIARGLLADPEKPRSLADAITLVGTCQDMCAEFERLQRTVQKDVWNEEKDPNQSAYSSHSVEPDEKLMVKKFRRAAAGIEEQLPSDLRPPSVLKMTCDYLFHDLLSNAESLAKVHHFVWDRTRAIRNDFSIQQITKPEDLSIAIECFERIVRFHIVSLHQLAVQPKPYDKYDAQQEREQLDRTLLSLMQYYDDSRGRVTLPNEAEFRAYCVIMQMQAPTPDLDDRVQTWPREVLLDARVQRALVLYGAACNLLDAQGPLKPRAKHVIAQQDWQRFWRTVRSKEVSYLMACSAEIYFNLIRRTVLQALLRTTSPNPLSMKAWSLPELCKALALDSEDEAQNFCEQYGMSFAELDGDYRLDLTPFKENRRLPEPSAGLQRQMRSDIVEDKRYGRTLPAVIDGFTVQRAREEGMVDDAEDMEMGEEEVFGANGVPEADDDENSLFVPQVKSKGSEDESASKPLTNGFGGFGQQSNQPAASIFNFGKPTNFGQTSGRSSPLAIPEKAADGNNNSAREDKKASAFMPATKSAFSAPSPFPGLSTGGFNFAGLDTSITQPPSAPTPEIRKGEDTAKQPFSLSGAYNPAQQPSVQDASPESPKGNEWFSNASATATVFPISGTVTTQATTPSQWQNAAPAVPKVTSANEPQKSPFTFGQYAGASQSTSTPSFAPQPETKLSQPHFTAPPSKSPSPKPSSPVNLPPTLNTGIAPRKQSDPANKPVKSSPLINSVSFEEDTDAQKLRQSVFSAPTQKVKVPFPGGQSQTLHSSELGTKQPLAPAVQEPNLDQVVERLAKELTLDTVAGYFKQYIDFFVDKTVNEVHDQLHIDQLNAEADSSRQRRLTEKYCKRWREAWWHQRLVKQGRDRRRRRQQRLELGKSVASDDNSTLGTNSVFGGSRAGSVIGNALGVDRSRQDMYDTLLRSSDSAQHPQAKAGGKRPMSSHGADASNTSQQSGHKRFKSVSHVNDAGRISKPSVTSQPNADILKRSSFLGFSLARNAPHNVSTTKSNYFKLKALGIRADAGVDADDARGRKRRRSESVDSAVMPPPMAPASSSPPQKDYNKLPGTAPWKQTTVSSNKALKAREDEDDALLARVKAAREALEAKTREVENLRRSTSSHETEADSPSMLRARAEARLRASQAQSPERNAPAYRSRESKFVPREQYGRAIDRAREFRESRSQDTSRPESRLDTQQSVETAATSISPDQATKQAEEEKQPSHQEPNGLPSNNHPSLSHEQWQTASPAQAKNASLAFSQQSSWGFDLQRPQENYSQEASFQTAKSQPFATFGTQSNLDAEKATNKYSSLGTQLAFGSAFGQPTFSASQDHTIQPSQIRQSLFNSFHEDQNHSYTPAQSPPINDLSLPARSIVLSQAASEAISLLSDDEDETETPQQPDYPSYINGFATADEHSEAQDGDENGELHASYGHANPFAALVNEEVDEKQDEDEEQQYDEEDDDEETEDDAAQYANHDDHRFANHSSYQQDTYDDDEGELDGEDGDIEDEDGYAEEDEEEAGYYGNAHFAQGPNGVQYDDDETEEATEDDEDPTIWRHKQAYRANPQYINGTRQPTPNLEMQAVGNTEAEAIELSD